MQTPPAAFRAFQNQIGTQVGTILKITDGTTTWLISEMEANLTDGHVHPLLGNYSIYQSFSIYTKQWTVSSVTLTLSNLPYKQNTSGTWIRLSDEIIDIVNRTAQIYYLCGGTAAALSDCLTYYTGIILEPPEYDDDNIHITIHNKSIPYNKDLPATPLGSIYTTAPPEMKSLFIPIVYGEFTTDFTELKKSGNGLARAYAISKLFNNFVVSNHIIDALTFAYLLEEDNNDISQYIAPTLNVNSSGRGRITDTAGLAQAWLYPLDTDDDRYSMDGITYNDLTNIIDRDTATNTDMLVNLALGDGTAITPKAIYMMGLNDGFLQKIKTLAQAAYKFSTYFVKNATYTYDLLERRLYFFNDSNLGDVYNSETLPSAASYQESAGWAVFPTSVTSIIRPQPSANAALSAYVSVEQSSFSGLGDSGMVSGGTYAPLNSDGMKYRITITQTGTPDKFSWTKGQFVGNGGTNVNITGAAQALDDGVTVTFAATTGHTINNSWDVLVHADTNVVDAASNFIGGGLNDMTSGGTFTGQIFNAVSDFQVVIDGTGTPNTFKWRYKSGQGTLGGAYSAYTTLVSITGGVQTLVAGVTVKFDTTINHTVNDTWTFKAHAAFNKSMFITTNSNYTGDKDVQYKLVVNNSTYAGFDSVAVYKDSTLIKSFWVGLATTRIIDEGVECYFIQNAQHDLDDYWLIDCFTGRDVNSTLMMGLYVEGNLASGPRIASHSFGDISEARLKVRYLADGKLDHFVECRGREYGAWITGRTSAYAVNNMISDPSGIIESILRDELGFVDADIDLPTFITAENTSVAARMNLHSDNRLAAFEAIRQIAEQSTFAYVFTAAGKSRAVELDNTTPTTVRTIPLSHIRNGKVTITKASDILNKLVVQSRWLEEYDLFADNTETNHSSSQTASGIRRFEAEWENIAGTSATHVANHLVGNSNAIWANRHNQIEFETIGMTNTDLELGDWISLDSFAIDPQFLCFGVSWSGKKFLIIELSQNLDGTRIKALELY